MEKEFVNYHIGRIVKIISIYNEKFLNKKFQELDLTTSQARVLGYLFNNQDRNITTRDLEKHFDLSHPTLVGIIKRLHEKNFINYKDDPNDKRCKYIEITVKTIKTSIRAKKILDLSEEVMSSGLSKEEIENFKRISSKIFDNICEVIND